nr:hypothetical protein [Sulfuriferula sp. AH1]
MSEVFRIFSGPVSLSWNWCRTTTSHDQPRPEITEMDYGMDGGGLRMKLRAATAGYTLRQWNVDCSPDHSLRGHEYRLWLKDCLAIYGVKNAILAPGYKTQEQNSLDTEID